MESRRIIPKNILKFDVVDSTNDKAKELLDRDTKEGTVVLASRQAAGKGRYGRAWASPPGGLYFSILLTPKERNVQLLSLLSGLPVARTLRGFGIEASLKWPNDVLVHGLKVCGILCEGVYRHDVYWAIVGIGVNVVTDLRRVPKDVQSTATSLKREIGGSFEPESVLTALLREYDDFYATYVRQGTERLLAEYRGLCSTLGKSVVIEMAKGRMRGNAVDISEAGALVLDSAGKRTEIFEGTIIKMA
jgi:BirA family biotin operon repressor/biotin-[acetyl-CoA-carboxylase] ligase